MIKYPLRSVVVNSRKVYASSDFACGYLEAMVLEMFQKLPESEQAVYLRVLSDQNNKLEDQVALRGL